MRIRAAIVALSLVGSTASAQVFAGHDMRLNGSGGNGTPLITGGVLRLSNDAYSSASSAFTTATFDFTPTTAWSTSFTLHYAYTSADTPGFTTGGDGISFIMQSGAATALGGGGGGMGYDGIPNSLAVSLRSFWNDVWIGQDGATFSQFVNGPAGLEISSDVSNNDFLVNVALSYDGANHLSVGYETTNGTVFAPTIFTIDPSSLGSTVRLGFGSGTGAATQLAEVTEWEFRGLTESVATPEPATITLVGLGTAVLGMGVRRRRRA